MAFAKFQENRLRIDGEIDENHAILVNLTASITSQIHKKILQIFRNVGGDEKMTRKKFC